MPFFTVGRDQNGNKRCVVKVSHGRGFSIQTNGNMPETHRSGIGEWTWPEVVAYVRDHGTKAQKELLGII